MSVCVSVCMSQFTSSTMYGNIFPSFQHQADGWMPQDLSNFLWSSAALRCDLPLPLELIAQRAAQLTWQQFKPQDAQGTHWGPQP